MELFGVVMEKERRKMFRFSVWMFEGRVREVGVEGIG